MEINYVYEKEIDFEEAIESALQRELQVWESIYSVLESDQAAHNQLIKKDMSMLSAP